MDRPSDSDERDPLLRRVERATVAFEWAYVLHRAEVDGSHPTDAQLRRLIETGQPPKAALPYIASRIGTGPGRRTYREPYCFGLYGPFTQEQVDAVDDLRLLEKFFSGMDPFYETPLPSDPKETTDPGDHRQRTLRIPVWIRGEDAYVEADFEFRWIRSRELWRMRSPMQQAIEVTAKRHHMSIAALHRLWYTFSRTPKIPL